jgi:hypothetical protein
VSAALAGWHDKAKVPPAVTAVGAAKHPPETMTRPSCMSNLNCWFCGRNSSLNRVPTTAT